jgi:hypothetical protein
MKYIARSSERQSKHASTLFLSKGEVTKAINTADPAPYCTFIKPFLNQFAKELTIFYFVE